MQPVTAKPLPTWLVINSDLIRLYRKSNQLTLNVRLYPLSILWTTLLFLGVTKL